MGSPPRAPLTCVLASPTPSLLVLSLDPKCEDVLNTQANIEMTVSMVYLALHHHFAADSVSLPGLAAHFLKESEEERAHSMKFMEYQTLRGGSVQLQSIMMPKIEFPDSPRGDALYAMELSLPSRSSTTRSSSRCTRLARPPGTPSSWTLSRASSWRTS